VPGVEEGRAVFIHELHQREENAAPGPPKARVHGQRRDFGNISGPGADRGEIENALQREAQGAFTDQ